LKSVVYIISTSLSLRDYRRYAIEELNNNNVNVKVLNISRLVYPHKYKGNELQKCDFCNVLYISDIHDFYLFINQHKIDYVYITIGFLPKNILFELKNKNIKVAVQLWGPIPLAHSGRNRIINLIKNPIKTVVKIINKSYEKIRYGNVEYDYYLSVGEETHKKTILCHSYDFYLYLLGHSKIEQLINSNNFVVFLDQMLPLHPDFVLLKMKNNINSQIYFKKLNDYFTFVENKLNVKVIVAAHPRSMSVKNYKDLFQGREVFIGNTNELISKSLLTMAHYSTAINYSVIHNKKIFYLLSSELESIGMKKQLEFMCFETGSDIINIDIADDYHQGSSNINNEKYKEYKKKYITQRCDEITNGQIIINELLINN
jgi:hypothetical protein